MTYGVAIQQAKAEGREEAAEEALRVFTDLSSINYLTASEEISDILNQRTKISEVQLARRITLHFRDQYLRAERIAEENE